MSDEGGEDYFYRGGKKIPLRRVRSRATPGKEASAEAGEAYVRADAPPGAAADCVLAPTGEVVVRFAPDVPLERVERELTARGARVVRALHYLPNGFLVRARPGRGEALRLANELHEEPFVVAAEPNWMRRIPPR